MEYLFFLVPFFVYTSSLKSDLKWEETGMNKKTEIEPGIPALFPAVIRVFWLQVPIAFW
jgi:hypothetical protein